MITLLLCLTFKLKSGTMRGMNTHRRLFDLALKIGFLFPLSIFMGLAANLLVVAQAWYLSLVINRLFLQNSTISGVLPLLQIILIVIILRAVFTFVNMWLSGSLAEKVKLELRSSLLTKVDRLGPIWLRRQKTGEVATTLLQGVDAIETYFSQFLPQVLLAVALPIIILVVVFPFDLLTGVVFLVTAPLIPIFMILIGRMAEVVTKRQWKRLTEMGDFLLDSIRGLKTLLLLGRSRQRQGEIRQVSEEYRISTLNVLKVTFLSAFTLEMLATIATAVVAVEIGLRLLYGQLDFQRAFFILLLAPEFYLPMRNLSVRYHAAMAGVSAAGSIYKILDTPEFVQLKMITQSKDPCVLTGKEIGFRYVTYRYEDSDLDALDDFNFTFQPGRHYAIVGENGAGKSTLLNLMLQLLQPSSGVIELDGQDIRGWDPHQWRNSISWVSQRPSVFNTSLLENVRLFDSSYSEELVRVALSQARLGDLYDSLPKGLATNLYEMGERFSSGERQRLALARAFLKNGSIILMDEPTTHLDAQLNQEFLESLNRFIENRTTIVIAHHFPLMKLADEILYLRNGKLMESGSFDSLIDKAGYFSEFFQAERS
jgi:ATP-binding cassette, subfamily C, bacterial CydD